MLSQNLVSILPQTAGYEVPSKLLLKSFSLLKFSCFLHLPTFNIYGTLIGLFFNPSSPLSRLLTVLVARISSWNTAWIGSRSSNYSLLQPGPIKAPAIIFLLPWPCIQLFRTVSNRNRNRNVSCFFGFRIWNTCVVCSPWRIQVLLDFEMLTRALSPRYSLITSPLTSYADQIYSIHRTRTSSGFSLDIPLIMLVASILK